MSGLPKTPLNDQPRYVFFFQDLRARALGEPLLVVSN